MARVARIERHGGPEVIEWVDVDLPDPGPGEVRIKATAVGLNFIEVYQRTGLYPLQLPSGLGGEGTGVIEAIGPGVTGFKVGDRVGTFGPIGSYATARNVPAARSKAPTGWPRRGRPPSPPTPWGRPTSASVRRSSGHWASPATTCAKLTVPAGPSCARQGQGELVAMSCVAWVWAC